MSWWNKGADDKSHGRGQDDPNKFKNDTDRKDYQAGYERQKQQEQQQKKQDKK